VQAVPDEKWEASPHARYRPFYKQLRHLVCVQGVYLQGLRERQADWSKKHSHYSGSLHRDSLVSALREKDSQLESVLAEIDATGPDAFEMDWFGQRIGLGRYLHVLIQHEAIHHGEWSFFAALGGFETPMSWKLNWGL
jgi:hypothetical protein